MATQPGMLSDLDSLSQDLARLEMDRDSCDIVFVVSMTPIWVASCQ